MTYIEIRVYIKDNSDEEEVKERAEELKDEIADYVSSEYAPPIFTEEVTYEIKTGVQ